MDKAKRVTQAHTVLRYLAYGHWISGLEIVSGLRILCYTKRISELRQQGHNIEKRWNHKGFWEYRLVRP